MLGRFSSFQPGQGELQVVEELRCWMFGTLAERTVIPGRDPSPEMACRK